MAVTAGPDLPRPRRRARPNSGYTPTRLRATTQTSSNRATTPAAASSAYYPSTTRTRLLFEALRTTTATTRPTGPRGAVPAATTTATASRTATTGMPMATAFPTVTSASQAARLICKPASGENRAPAFACLQQIAITPPHRHARPRTAYREGTTARATPSKEGKKNSTVIWLVAAGLLVSTTACVETNGYPGNSYGGYPSGYGGGYPSSGTMATGLFLGSGLLAAFQPAAELYQQRLLPTADLLQPPPQVVTGRSTCRCRRRRPPAALRHAVVLGQPRQDGDGIPTATIGTATTTAFPTASSAAAGPAKRLYSGALQAKLASSSGLPEPE